MASTTNNRIQGLMEQSANLEALLNIMDNGIEVAGLTGGIPALLFCFIPYAADLRGY